ncbi:MAG: CBS domain-containing protein [Deltaproteobacteria bacterium]|nr:CBS domain-containing protein [Deltaproteobacteria bacterium]
MKRWVISVFPGDSILLAAERMLQHDVGFLPVCGSDNRPIGAITDRDIAVRAVAKGLSAQTRVSEVMTAEVLCLHHESELRAAEQMMMDHGKARIICIDDDGCVSGVISLSDLPNFENARKSGEVFAKVSEREAQP